MTAAEIAFTLGTTTVALGALFIVLVYFATVAGLITWGCPC